MSYQKEVYIGSYVEMKPKLVEIEVNLYKCNCAATETLYKPIENFCGICGSKIIKMKAITSRIQTLYDLLPENDESLSDPYLDDRLSDGKIYGVANFDYKSTINNSDQIALTTEEIRQDIDNFTNHFNDIIEHLRPQCETLEIKFGVIQYYS